MDVLTAEKRLHELINLLNDASKNYYDSPHDPVMSDLQYDKYLKELIQLEKETGICLPHSPTAKVGSDDENNKLQHRHPVLSLKSTKEETEMMHFLGEEEGVLSWKVDGVGLVLYYDDGILIKGLTRGDGHYGKDVTKNVRLMRGVPKTIPVKELTLVRGEGAMSLKDFEQINKTKEGEKFSNPRNLASGLINSSKTTPLLLKHMTFIAHTPILLDSWGSQLITRYDQLRYLDTLGFIVVPHTRVLNFELQHEIEKYTSQIDTYEFPVDGLVLALDDIGRGEILGTTAKYPKHSLAFKWQDISVLTTVTGVRWSVSNTGLITPIVTFKPVTIEGTIVKQANLHNLKGFEELKVGIGDTLKIYKANKIIPEVEENLTRSGTLEYPQRCPVCQGATTLTITPKTKKLYCYNCRR